MDAPALADIRIGARDVTRRFGSVVANDRIRFAARRGSVHAIVGGNGAGKSTLMRILQGLDRPDEGSVLLDGEPVVLDGPGEAFARGIGMVHQEFTLVPGLSLLENLVLGCEPAGAWGRIDEAAALKAGQALAAQAGVRVPWHTDAEEAPVHLRQIVEILRLLYRGADVLILDEPTAVLAPAQVRDLLALLRRLRDEGRTVLFISHKLDEVLRVADEITVIRGGRVAGSFARADADKNRLAALIVGEAMAAPEQTGKPEVPAAAEAVLEMQDVSLPGPGSGGLKNLRLTVRSGEIVGVCGVAGNGQDELVAAVSGLGSGAGAGGSIRLGGREIVGADMASRRAAGLAYLSPDRAGEGLCLVAPISENAVAGHQRRARFSRAGMLRRGALARHAEALLDRFSVKRDSAQAPVSSLSGGNQQRVAVARELDGAPKLLLACQPTRGVDIGGIAFIHRCLLDFCEEGGAVLLVSEELDELLALADRLVVLFEGRQVAEVPRGTPVEAIGRLMLGQAA